MEENEIGVRYNVMNITSLSSFVQIRGSIRNGCKDVYFMRCIGHTHTFLDEIASVDQTMREREASGLGGYQRIQGLPVLSSQEDASFYRYAYLDFLKSGQKQVKIKSTEANAELESRMGAALAEAAEKLKNSSGHCSETIVGNFAMKLLYWLDNTVGSFFHNWDEKLTNKLICSQITKKQEYLFLYFLTRLGIDVMILAPAGELPIEEPLLQLSVKLTMNQCSDLRIPSYQQMPHYNKEETAHSQQTAGGRAGTKRETDTLEEKRSVVRIPLERTRKQTGTFGTAGNGNRAGTPGTAASRTRTGISSGASLESRITRCEKTYEQLALCASSMVMISIYSRTGKPIGSGSGIMINQDGCLLTNYHVTEGGAYYTVRIEEDENLYETDELIKYNAHFDLSIIRIARKLNPIPIYRGSEQLVRGQRVVAIGSPLGMFNTVSDGIISGFRTINYVDMIQFTAPISHGSSGGALLNLYGEVIGISTAGFDNGQNLNLAVHYQYLNDFVRGFVGSND